MSDDINDQLLLAAQEEEPPVKAAKRPLNAKKLSRALPDIHRLLPQSTDAELGVLASFVISPKEVGVLCVQKGVNEETFHEARHALIFRALMDLWSAGKSIDIISLTEKLRNRDQLEAVGGPSFVTQLAFFLPSARNVDFYISVIQDKKVLRDAITMFTEWAARAYDEQDDVPAYINAAHQAVTQLAIAKQKPPKALRSAVLEFIDEVGRRERGEQIQLFTGLTDLDHDSPVGVGDYVGIAGYTKSGKTALAASIVKYVCQNMGLRTAVFSLEMRTLKWIERMVADIGSIEHRYLRNGQLPTKERESLRCAAEQISKWKLDIYEDIFDCESILANIRTLKIRHPDLTLVVLDYFQLARMARLPKGTNREQELSWFSRQIQQLTQQLGITMVVLSQLNEQGNARDSKSIMQDCTHFWHVVQELDEHGRPKKSARNNRTIWVQLQRSGEGDIRIPVRYFGHYTRFENDPDFIRSEDQPELPMPEPRTTHTNRRFRKQDED